MYAILSRAKIVSAMNLIGEIIGQLTGMGLHLQAQWMPLTYPLRDGWRLIQCSPAQPMRIPCLKSAALQLLMSTRAGSWTAARGWLPQHHSRLAWCQCGMIALSTGLAPMAVRHSWPKRGHITPPAGSGMLQGRRLQGPPRRHLASMDSEVRVKAALYLTIVGSMGHFAGSYRWEA